VGGVEQHGIGGGTQWGNGAVFILRVPVAHFGEDLGVIGGDAAGEQLGMAAAGALLGRGGDEELGLGGGEDDGADIAPIEHGAMLAAEAALEFEQFRPHIANGGNGSGGHIGHRAAQIGAGEIRRLERAGGGEACLLDIPRWDFHWQGSYGLVEPVVFNPGDQLRLSCTWDNATMSDVTWGEGTTDEMCLGSFYYTVND